MELIPHPHNRTFSVVKALGILAVVTSHAAIRTPLETFTYYFNTPIFFFVAGYFFDDREIAMPGRFVMRKLRRLYLPYVAMGALFVLLHNKLLEWHLIAWNYADKTPIPPYDSSELLHTLGQVLLFHHHEQILAPLWFLQGLFFGLMLFFCITFLAARLAAIPARREWIRGGAVATLTVVALALAAHPSLFRGEVIVIRTLLITALIYLGKLYRRAEKRIPLRHWAAILCLFILVAAARSGYRLNLGGARLGDPWVTLPLIVMGCYMLVTFASKITADDNPLVRALDYTGRHTLAVMLWHIPVFKLVIIFQVFILGFPVKSLGFHPVIYTGASGWWLIYTVCGMIIPLLFCLLWDRIRRFVRR